MDIKRLLNQAELSGATAKDIIGMILSNRCDMATSAGALISVKNFGLVADDILLWISRSTPEWQPIKTAPKDGTLILLGKADDPEWPLRCRRWSGTTGFGHWRGQDGNDATHWMPLPTHPIAE